MHSPLVSTYQIRLLRVGIGGGIPGTSWRWQFHTLAGGYCSNNVVAGAVARAREIVECECEA